jgi:hypothetical protein
MGHKPSCEYQTQHFNYSRPQAFVLNCRQHALLSSHLTGIGEAHQANVSNGLELELKLTRLAMSARQLLGRLRQQQ